jgi:hypothetical protein
MDTNNQTGCAKISISCSLIRHRPRWRGPLTYLWVVLLLIVLYPACTIFGQQATSLNFEGWKGGGGIKIDLSPDSTLLHAYGNTTGGTILTSPTPYAAINHETNVIKVSMMVNVVACYGIIQMKCYFIGQNKENLGNFTSSYYDAVRSGTWQKLAAWFPIPETAASLRITVLQGNSGQIDLSLKDLVVEQVDKIEPLGIYANTPLPKSLEPFSGIHPRLFIDKTSIAELKGKITTPPYDAFWAKLKTKVDAIPAPEPIFPNCVAAIRQRGYAYSLPKLAFVWLLTGDPRYLERATTIATAMANAPSWGGCGTTSENKDLVAGGVLFGLSLFYDWCYDVISPELKTKILDKINYVSSIMAKSVVSPSIADPWWKNAYLCNQVPVGLAGLAAAGLATFDELGDAPAWLQITLDKIENLLTFRADDGTHIEGIGYWGYDLDSLLKIVYLFSKNLGVPLPTVPAGQAGLYQHEWLKNTGMYRLYMGLPRNSWTRKNQVVDFDDAVRANWYGPDVMLRGLAKEYQNSYLQWLANEVDRERFTDDEAEWLNLVWTDPNLPAQKPDSLPTLRHFEDLGIVSARSDWSGDESLLVYTAGPSMGHKALHTPSAGYLFAEHFHPDVGHFVLFANGEWQLRDDGYWDDKGGMNPKKTENHNTLVIDGIDQLRANEMFAKKAEPSIIDVFSSSDYDVIQSDLRAAYKPDLGLLKFKRTLIFIKPNLLIVIDDIALKETHNLELLFHTQNPVEAKEGPLEGYFIAQGKNSKLRIDYFPKTDAEGRAGVELYSNGKLAMPTVRLHRTSDKWRNVTTFSWLNARLQPQRLRISEAGDKWIFETPLKTITFDWTTASVTVAGQLSPP